jgi:2-(1,2-epoxy-1,2-dihydrophenyl)acetyl-CoA isomerase
MTDLAAMQLDTLRTEVVDGVLTITLNRPDKLNAWTYQMGAELRAAILAANADPAIEAMVVTGAGRSFCAGADIEMVFDAQSKATPAFKAEADTDDWVALLRRSKPMIAAINGVAIGMGVTLILPMDYLICSTNAKLSLRFVKLGLVPELASSYYVVQRAGFGVASELMLTGRMLTAQEAVDVGLVDRVTAPEELLPAAQAMARAMGENPQAALAEIKALLTQNGSDPDLAAVQLREFAALDRCYASAEHREAIDAFMAKRAPDFKRVRSG